MARDERKLLEEIAIDIAKSQYDYRLDDYLKTVQMVKGMSNKALVDFITK